MKKATLVVLMTLGLAGPLAASANDNNGQNQRPPRQPPAEAVEACAGQQQGAAVSFTTPRGDTLSASCEEIQGQLVAVPEGHKRRGGDAPQDGGDRQ